LLSGHSPPYQSFARASSFGTDLLDLDTMTTYRFEAANEKLEEASSKS
jgi:hypothetical protein